MAKSAGEIRAWATTLGGMVDEGRQVQVWCTDCKKHKNFTREEIAALAEKLGRDYSLVNRRCKCRLTPGCKGWNCFAYLNGVMHNLRTYEGRDAQFMRDCTVRRMEELRGKPQATMDLLWGEGYRPRTRKM